MRDRRVGLYDDGSFDADSPDEITQFVRERLDTIGVANVFREYDATGIDADSVSITGDSEASANPFGFDVTLGGPETRGGVTWQTENMRRAVRDNITAELDSVEKQYVDGFDDAYRELETSMLAVVLPTTFSGTIGYMPPCELSLDGDSFLDFDEALAVDVTSLGFAVTFDELSGNVYHDTEADTDVLRVRYKVDHIVTNPDAIRYVDLETI